jgi:preprotein translocase subunit SecG
LKLTASQYIFANAHTKSHADSKHTPLNLFSIARVHFLKMVILILLMLCLLCLPLVPLYSWTQGGGGQADGETDSAAVTGQTLAKIMGLIVACAFAFGVVLSVCTRAKKHEIFGSCAA